MKIKPIENISDMPCIAQKFIDNLPEKDKTNPVMISCPCKRCTPSYIIDV